MKPYRFCGQYQLSYLSEIKKALNNLLYQVQFSMWKLVLMETNQRGIEEYNVIGHPKWNGHCIVDSKTYVFLMGKVKLSYNPCI